MSRGAPTGRSETQNDAAFRAGELDGGSLTAPTRRANPLARADGYRLEASAKAVLTSVGRYKAILKLAMPTVLAMLSQSVVNEVDVIYFSHLPCPDSSNGQAARIFRRT